MFAKKTSDSKDKAYDCLQVKPLDIRVSSFSEDAMQVLSDDKILLYSKIIYDVTRNIVSLLPNPVVSVFDDYFIAKKPDYAYVVLDKAGNESKEHTQAMLKAEINLAKGFVNLGKNKFLTVDQLSDSFTLI